jgi:hypothetical protein
MRNLRGEGFVNAIDLDEFDYSVPSVSTGGNEASNFWPEFWPEDTTYALDGLITPGIYESVDFEQHNGEKEVKVPPKNYEDYLSNKCKYGITPIALRKVPSDIFSKMNHICEEKIESERSEKSGIVRSSYGLCKTERERRFTKIYDASNRAAAEGEKFLSYPDESEKDIKASWETHRSTYWSQSYSSILGIWTCTSMAWYYCVNRPMCALYSKFANNISSFVLGFVCNAVSGSAVKAVKDRLSYFKACLRMTLRDLLDEFEEMTSDFRLRLIELKAMVHIIVCAFYNDATSALNHASYLMLTRPIGVDNVALNAAICGWIAYSNFTSSTIRIKGKEYNVSANEAQRLFELSDMGAEINENEITEQLEVHSGTLEAFTNTFGSWLAQWKIGGLTTRDIETANKQFAFVKNVQNDLTGKAQFVVVLLRLVLRTVYGYDPCDAMFQNYSSDVVDLMVRIREIHDQRQQLIANKQLMLQAMQAFEEAEKLNGHARMASLPGFLQRAWSEKFRQISVLNGMAMQLLRGAQQRAEPVCVLFLGAPGSGKSPGVEIVKRTIGVIENDPYSPEQVYLLNSSKFWEGYGNQKYVVGDDIFKLADSDQLKMESGRIIDMINTSPYNLDMAFEGKGTTFFDSKYVFLTSNYAKEVEYDKVEWRVGLKDPNALKKRFHFVLERSEKSHDDATQNLYNVAKCDTFPRLVGRKLNPYQIADVAKRMRDEREQRLQRQTMSDAEIADALDAAGITNDFQQHNGEFENRKPVDATEWALKLIPLQLYEWSESEHAKWFWAGFAALLLIVTVPTLLSYFGPDFDVHSAEDKKQSQHYPTHNYNARKVRSSFMHPSDNFGYSTVPVPGFDVHSGVDFISSLRNTIFKSVGRIEMASEQDPEGTYGVAFHIKDGYMVTPAHVVMPYNIKGVKAKMRITFPSGAYDFDMPNVCKLDGEDCALFKLPTSVPLPPSAYKYLIEAKSMPEIGPTQTIYQVGLVGKDQPEIRTLTRIPWTGRVTYQVAGEMILMVEPTAYVGSCSKGHSGCPSIIDTPHGPKIVGMHVGACGKVTRLGVSTLLCKEWMDEVLPQCMEVHASSRIKLEVQETVPAERMHRLPFKTRIKPSRIHGWHGPPTMIPAKFDEFVVDGVKIDPLVVAMSKLRQHEEPLIGYEDNRAIEYLRCRYPPKSDARVFTYEEALNGIPGRSIPSIVGSTSPGYPYSLLAKKGKNPYIVQVDNKYVYQAEFLAQVQECEDHLRRGEQIEVIWSDTLKDETRPIEKVFKGKTRLFTSCPLHFLILVRRYTLDFVTEVQKLAATHPIAVGLNVHSLQWTVLRQRISRFGKSIISGDFANYDASIPTEVGKTVLKFINLWYNNAEDGAVRALLFEHFWDGTRICLDGVYKTKGGNPSGNPITSIFNSLANVVICYIVLTQDVGLMESDFDLSVYGDDNIIGVNLDGLRCSDLTPHFLRRFNMTYTHFSKSDVDPVDTMDTIRFLGRRFAWNDGKYQAPLELATIVESTYWVRGADSDHRAFCSTVMSYYLEMSHFPLEVYRRATDRILEVISTSAVSSQYDYLARVRKTWYEFQDIKYDDAKRKVIDFYSRGNSITWLDQVIMESHCGEFEKHSGTMEKVDVSRNEEFTERATNAVATTQEVQLGTYQDAAPVSAGAMDKVTLLGPQSTCNMEVFTLDDVIQREFPVSTFTWDQTAASGTTLSTIQFPSVLFSQPFIQEKIKDFRLFRASIRISVRIVANKFLYGKLLCFYWPNTSATIPATVIRCSAVPHILLSASSGDTMTFDVPFVSFRRALDLNSYSDQAMGTFGFIVVNALTDIMGEASTANVYVTAQFRDAELFMPHDSAGNTISKMVSARYFDAHMFEPHSGKVHKGKAGLVKEKFSVKGKEARNKIAKNTTSMVENSTEVLDSGVESLAFTASYISGAVSTLTSLAAMIGLSKPKTTDAVTINKINPFCDINTGAGVDFSSTLGMDPENAISTLPNVAGCTTDEMDFKQFCGTPVLVRIQQFSQGNSTPQTLAFPNFQKGQPGDDFCGYAEMLSNMFLYVSGSKKVKIYITASLYHSARFVLYLTDSSTSAVWQNCYHMIVDVQGDTEVEFTLPYCSSNISNETSGETEQFALVAFPLSWSQPDDSLTTPIYFNVYTAAANDIQFGGLVETWFEIQSCPRVDFVSDFQPFHSSVLSYDPVNVIYGERYTTIREIVHKYQAMYPISFNAGIQIPAYAGGGNQVLGVWTGLEMVGQMFRFWRGSTRFKLLTPSINPMSLYVTKGSSILVGSAVSSVVNQAQEIEIPYYDNRLYADTSEYSDIVINVRTGLSTNSPLGFYLSAAGDDFSFHFQSMPRSDGAFTNVAPNTNVGFVGMANSLQPYQSA